MVLGKKYHNIIHVYHLYVPPELGLQTKLTNLSLINLPSCVENIILLIPTSNKAL